MHWKTARNKSKKQKKTKLAILTLTLILLILVIGNLVKVGKGLSSPLTPDSNRKTYTWDSTFNLNLVLLTKPLSVITYKPTEGAIKILEIPDETYLEAPGGYGSWRAGAIYKLGGASLLKESFASFLGLPIDGFLGFKQAKSPEDLIGDLKNPLSVLKNLYNLQTDLSPIELARLSWGLRGVRFDKVDTFNLESLGLLTSSTLSDGTPALIGDPAKIDALTLKNFTDPKIVEEGATIAVFNATGVPGQAAFAAQVISHIGGNVVIQTGSEKAEFKTAVLGTSTHPFTTKRLKQIFAASCIEDCGILTSAGDFSRAQINVVLGQ